MADILIRGMKMPENCLFCPCSFWDERTLGLWCHARSIYDDNVVAENVTAVEAHGGKPSKAKRPDWCPLIELPEHGDLIDRDWLKGMAYSKVEDFGGAFLDTVDIAIAPVVIPSNKENKNAN